MEIEAGVGMAGGEQMTTSLKGHACAEAATLERIRRRLASGFYDSDEVLAMVAAAIVSSGQLDGGMESP